MPRVHRTTYIDPMAGSAKEMTRLPRNGAHPSTRILTYHQQTETLRYDHRAIADSMQAGGGMLVAL